MNGVQRLMYRLSGASVPTRPRRIVDDAADPIEAAVSDAALTRVSGGAEWAPTIYGTYYATSTNVYAAIKKRASAVTRPPLVVYRVNGDEKTRVEPDDPYQSLLDKVNPFWSRSQFWRGLSTYLDVWGSAFVALKGPSPRSLKPDQMWLLRPDRVRIVPSRDKYIEGFLYESGRERLAFAADEIIWFRYFNPLDEFGGLAPLAPIRLSVDMGIEAMRYNRAQFKNRLNVDQIVFVTPGPVSEEEIGDFRKRLKERFAKPSEAWNPMVLANGIEAKNLGFSPKEMEHIQTLRWSLEDVSRAYDIPKLLLGDLERATYSNFQQAELMFWRSIAEHLMFLQEQVNEFLSPKFGAEYVAEFDLSRIEALQPDSNALAERQRQDVTSGIVTINEVRAERGLEPVEWGDSWWAPITNMPVGSAGSEAGTPAGSASILLPSASDAAPMEHRRWISPAMSDENLLRVVTAHTRRLTGTTREFHAFQAGLFETQKESVLRRLRAQEQRAIEEKQEFEDLFDVEEWTGDWIRDGRPHFGAAVQAAGEATSRDFALGVAFDVKLPPVARWLEQRTRFWATRVNEDTARYLVQEIEAGRHAGESVRQLQERVGNVFDFSSLVRSEMIARTEVQASVNRGSLEAYRQSGVVAQKMWIATLDERTRETHLMAHRQTVPLDQPFVVGGEEIQHPGDGSAANVVNCRCTMIPIVARRGIGPEHEAGRLTEERA